MSTTTTDIAVSLVNLLQRQRFIFTKDQLDTCCFLDSTNALRRITPDVFRATVEVSSSVLNAKQQNQVLRALSTLKLERRGRPPNTRERLSSEGYRCYRLGWNGRASIPAGTFLNLEPGSKITAYFVAGSDETYIKLVKHK